MNAPNGGASVLIGGRGYGTCIENHNLRGVWRGCAFEPSFDELLFDRGSIRLSRPAAKILDVETRHAYILTYKR